MQKKLKAISEAVWFHQLVIGAILIAAVCIGLETYPEIVKKHGTWLHAIDKVILWIFVAEIVVKMGALGKDFWKFFKDGWNVFDFLIVVVCFVPIDAQFVAVLRLARLLRVLKLVTALPRLQLIVGALLKAIPSIGYVGVLLVLHFYIFAVVATTTFGPNDPFRFGDLQTSLLTLFQVATMEGWADIMQTQILGCDAFGYDDTIKHLCTAPAKWPVVAPTYFIVFIMLGTMIILNLFIGVIMNGMEEMQAEVAALKAKEQGTPDSSLEQDLARLSAELASLHERVRRRGA